MRRQLDGVMFDSLVDLRTGLDALADDGGPVFSVFLGVRAAVRRVGVDGRASTDEEA